ncbi:hypothetical protein QFZ52_002452 [Arthrobacter woluwensis]|uniref:hypothetical protein n=1 Tax=Arthrobacter woluwensis TaxID=156980 RepID=UPI00278A3C8D|nr:hypothetical protein [Arthrobacter woluwensis]MDQ0709800.1 hypothetical protein [Arthrobacter woluwensis]
MTQRRRRGLGALLAGAVLVTPFTLGAAQAPESQPAAFCLPILFTCASPTPTPTPGTPKPSATTPAPGAGTPSVPAGGSGGMPVIPVPGDSGTSAPGSSTPSGSPSSASTDPAHPSPGAKPSPKKPVKATREDGAPIFTRTPASLGSRGLSFTGLHSIGIVSVPTVDGGSVRALKISADSITITGFSLTVRPPNGPGLVTTADTMKLEGHVDVYLGSVTATTANGRSLTLGTDTPPPLDDVAPGLLRVTMGLVGSTADSISYTNTNQRIVES